MSGNRGLVLLFFALALQLLIACGHNKDSLVIKEESQVSIQLSQSAGPDSVLPYIYIEDTSGAGLDFTFSLNNLFWFSPDSMINFIQQIPVEDCYNTEKEIIQAWIFAGNFSFHHASYAAGEKITYSPGMLFNSVGYGLCDVRSAALCMIWQQMGYKTRVNKLLDFHLFPEVYDGEKWMMLDPDFGICLVNSNNRIASVEEIKKDSGQLTVCSIETRYPHFCISQNFVEEYSPYLENIYKSSASDSLDNLLLDNVNWPAGNFKLPPNSIVEFPVFTDSLISPVCKITILDSYCGFVQIPLVIAGANNAVFESTATVDCKGKGVGYWSDKLWVCGKNIEILAYVNPALFVSENEIKFNYYSGNTVLPKVLLGEVQKPETHILFIISGLFEKMLAKKELMHKLYEHYVADEQIDITGREEMIKATGVFLKDEVKSFDTATIHRNIAITDSLLSRDTAFQKMFYKNLGDTDLFATILLVMEQIKPEDLEIVLGYFYKSE